MKIGYKGFDNNLKCRGFQFEIGGIYDKGMDSAEGWKPTLCTSMGFHYCSELVQVFNFYKNNGSNRFCEIEIIGPFTEDADKGITTCFRIIRELSDEEIGLTVYEENLNLDLIKSIQQEYPMFHVGGSAGLYLHGVRLQRWKKGSGSDIDLVSPYFVLPVSSRNLDIDYINGKASANDFDETFICNGTKVDYRIDPKQRYEVIEYKGFKYKVSPMLTILEAKMRYAMQGNSKHSADIKEMVVGRQSNKKLTVSGSTSLFS